MFICPGNFTGVLYRDPSLWKHSFLASIFTITYVTLISLPLLPYHCVQALNSGSLPLLNQRPCLPEDDLLHSVLPQTQLAGLSLVLEQSTRVSFPYFPPFPRLHLCRFLRTSSQPHFPQPLIPANTPQGTYLLNRAMKQSMPRHFLKRHRGNRN